MAAIRIADLENAKADVDHIAEIATSTSASATDRLGRSKRTIAGAQAEIAAGINTLAASVIDAVETTDAALAGIGYQPPVAYAAGLSMTQSRQTVTYSGQTYAPIVGALPFTTTGTFETAKFRLIQGVAGADLAATGGAALVGFVQLGTGAVARTALAKLRELAISVKDFGAVGNGVADDTAAIQLAIDYAIYGGGKGRVFVPAGRYRTTGPIHLGYGTGFTSVVIEGEGYSYRGEAGFSGSAIIADFSNAPAIVFQGARGSVLRGMTILGKNFNWIKDKALGSSTEGAPLLDDTDAANWVDPALDPRADTRYAPYAAVAIDPYSGTRPATSYPDVSYPEWLGAVSQYGKGFSSDVLIEDCFIAGFVVGVVNQPCDADGNGDFTALRRVNMEKVKYGFSVGNSQSRNVLLSEMKIAGVYCCIANNIHGKQKGKLNGTVSNLSVGACINIVDLSPSFSGPVTFLHLYSEGLWRIGDIRALSSNEETIRFESCDFSLTGQNQTRGVPASVLGGWQQPCELVFAGCTFNGFPSVCYLSHQNTVFEGSSFKPTERDSTIASEYLRLAHNAICGGAVIGIRGLAPLGTRHRIKFKQANLDTGAITAVVAQNSITSSSRTHCIPAHVDQVVPSSVNGYDPVQVHRQAAATQAKSGLAACSLSGKTLTIQFTSRTEDRFASHGPDNGDVIIDDRTGMVFFVRARTGTTVTAEAQNNYRDAGSGSYQPVTPFSTTEGTLYFLNSRLYTPSYPLFGDLTSGNATITNCQRADAFSGFIDAAIAVGDWLLVHEQIDRPFTPANARVAARDQATKTITLSGNASVTAAQKRLGIWVRKAPANA